MTEIYTCGIAFILEGDTEKIFYYRVLCYFVEQHPGAKIVKCTDKANGETYYSVQYGERNVLIKFNVVGTISQITHSVSWFQNRCYKKHRGLKWKVFLCYDTDSYNNDIGKFYEGDWKELRKSIEKNRNCSVTDLAAQADIEDIMLLDSDGVFKYLDMLPVPIPNGKKGKRKMKKIFRMKGSGYAYHEGNRAVSLIDSLDFKKIISLSDIPFSEVEKSLLD
ncbi:MAG: hypothetical protein IJS61_04515 [Firmicutes bacterium]|nr:hypothetical protein [Bacillota bacterium]